MATKTATKATTTEGTPLAVPEAEVALDAARVAYADITQQPTATDAQLVAGQLAVIRAEATLAQARREAAAAPDRALAAQLGLLEQRVQAVYDRQPQRAAEAMRLKASRDDAAAGIASDNAELAAIVAELTLLGVPNDDQGVASWGAQRYGGGVRVLAASMCRQALPSLGLPWLPFVNPGRFIPPPADARTPSCAHRNTFLLEGSEAKLSGLEGARYCQDCQQVLHGPDKTTRLSWGSIILGPLGLGR